MNKYLLIWLTSIAPLSLYSAEATQEGYLSSTQASYDGSALILSGHVVLDHGLGKMTAEEASLEKQETGKDFPFALIHLNKEVLLSLKNSGTLHCDHADLDFNALKGHLSADTSSFVQLADQILKKGSEGQLLLKSPKIELTFLKNEKTSKKVEYDVDTILAKDSVFIDFNKEFLLQADHALYRKLIDSASPSREYQGVITAYPKDNNSLCTLTHKEDIIEASSIDLDMIEKVLCMHKPKGVIASSLLPHLQRGHVKFSSDFMTWDSIKEILSFKGHSEIIESTLGKIITEQELIIKQTKVKGKTALSKIETKGPSELIYQDKVASCHHKICCKGSMKLDRQSLSALLISPNSSENKGSFAEQVYYEEMKMGAYADTALVEFSEENELLHPVSLSLKGHVALFSRSSSDPFRCALADRMSYCPDTKTLILSANPGQKVLFWDEQQSVRMSAQEVHLTQNPMNQQTVIQGVGNVKFSLSTEENDTLKKFFPQYKPLP